MLKTFYSVVYISLARAIVFEDCATDPNNAVVTWNHFDFGPLPVVFPGHLHISVILGISRSISQPIIDTELYRNEGGISVEVPCIPNTNIGTCTNTDLCPIIDRMNNVSTADTLSFQQQIDEIMLTPLGDHTGCPIGPVLNEQKNKTITLQPLSPLILRIFHGHYTLQLAVKENSTSIDNIGCMRFNFTIAEEPQIPVG